MSTVKTDAQFMERFENFAFKEVVEEESVALETNTRYLAILASLVGSQGLDAYKFILKKPWMKVWIQSWSKKWSINQLIMLVCQGCGAF